MVATSGTVAVGQPTNKLVLSLVNRETGEVRSHVVRDVKVTTIGPILGDEVDVPASILQTDTAQAYRGVGPQFAQHETVNHFRHEYVRGDVSTKRGEGYFPRLKRSLEGTDRAVSRVRLSRYLGEFDFLYTTSKMDDSCRMRTPLAQVGGAKAYL